MFTVYNSTFVFISVLCIGSQKEASFAIHEEVIDHGVSGLIRNID